MNSSICINIQFEILIYPKAKTERRRSQMKCCSNLQNLEQSKYTYNGETESVSTTISGRAVFPSKLHQENTVWSPVYAGGIASV